MSENGGPEMGIPAPMQKDSDVIPERSRLERFATPAVSRLIVMSETPEAVAPGKRSEPHTREKIQEALKKSPDYSAANAVSKDSRIEHWKGKKVEGQFAQFNSQMHNWVKEITDTNNPNSIETKRLLKEVGIDTEGTDEPSHPNHENWQQKTKAIEVKTADGNTRTAQVTYIPAIENFRTRYFSEGSDYNSNIGKFVEDVAGACGNDPEQLEKALKGDFGQIAETFGTDKSADVLVQNFVMAHSVRDQIRNETNPNQQQAHIELISETSNQEVTNPKDRESLEALASKQQTIAASEQSLPTDTQDEKTGVEIGQEFTNKDGKKYRIISTGTPQEKIVLKTPDGNLIEVDEQTLMSGGEWTRISEPTTTEVSLDDSESLKRGSEAFLDRVQHPNESTELGRLIKQLKETGGSSLTENDDLAELLMTKYDLPLAITGGKISNELNKHQLVLQAPYEGADGKWRLLVYDPKDGKKELTLDNYDPAHDSFKTPRPDVTDEHIGDLDTYLVDGKPMNLAVNKKLLDAISAGRQYDLSTHIPDSTTPLQTDINDETAFANILYMNAVLQGARQDLTEAEKQGLAQFQKDFGIKLHEGSPEPPKQEETQPTESPQSAHQEQSEETDTSKPRPGYKFIGKNGTEYTVLSGEPGKDLIISVSNKGSMGGAVADHIFHERQTS